MKRRPAALLAFVLWLPQAQGYGVLPRDAVAAAARAVENEPLPPDLASALALAATLRPASPLIAELRLRRLLLAAAQREPDVALRAQVEALVDVVPLALSTSVDPDHGRGLAVPVVDLAAVARGTLRQWSLRETTAHYRRALEDGALRVDAALDAPALAQALREASEAAVEGFLSDAAPWPGEALAVAAVRRPSRASFGRVFAAPVESATYAALEHAVRELAPDDALAVLTQASARAELASAAMLALRPLAGRADVQRFAVAQLGDRDRGGSAAALLVHSRATAVRGEIGAILQRKIDSPGLRRALTVLQRIDDADARRTLLAVARDAQHAPAIRALAARGAP